MQTIKQRFLILTAVVMGMHFSSVSANPKIDNPKINKIDKQTTVLVEKNAQELVADFQRDSNFDKKNIFNKLTEYLKNNPEVYGASFSFLPDKQTGQKLAPYVYRDGDKLTAIDLANSYDYTVFDWYKKPIETKQASWSQPYYDEGAGNAWMVTYSIPVYSEKGPQKELVGVVTNDVLVTVR